MESAGFLGRPQQHQKQLSILSWNVNGVRTKLEKKNVQDLLLDYDIVCFSEIKTPLSVSLPGYVTYKSQKKEAPHRGGTIAMLKNYISVCDLRGY